MVLYVVVPTDGDVAVQLLVNAAGPAHQQSAVGDLEGPLPTPNLSFAKFLPMTNSDLLVL